MNEYIREKSVPEEVCKNSAKRKPCSIKQEKGMHGNVRVGHQE